MEQAKSAFEDQIAAFRSNRKMIRINQIPFKATRIAFESALREKLSNSDSPRFFWPPVDKAKLNNPARHLGWVMVGFDQRDQCRQADRASRVAFTSGSSGKRKRPADSEEASTTAPSVAGPSFAATPAVPTPTSGNTTVEAALLPGITPENAPAAMDAPTAMVDTKDASAVEDAHSATKKRKLNANATEDAHAAEDLPIKKRKLETN
ncbi:unnamed protein product [Clonostachys solani]|uniref:Uncharacterized protein n=1 Tax=Clonostachys solani TaxID=160281 RepID=A0A9N9ZA40_9HYPO|nr:unnamed protein product [Clonostachys solani]